MCKLKAMREALGLSQTDLANKAGIHKIMISKLERGERKLSDATVRTAKALADALEVTVDELLEEEEEGENNGCTLAQSENCS